MCDLVGWKEENSRIPPPHAVGRGALGSQGGYCLSGGLQIE